MTQDPIQRLLAEHVALQAKFEPLRRAAAELERGGQAAVDAALPALREVAHVMTTELIAHARREDDVFFPAVEAAIGGAFGPTAVMRQEHAAIHAGAESFRATLRELQDVQHPAIVEGGARLSELAAGVADARELQALATALLHLIDDHFAKEEQILFPMSREILDAESLRAVGQRMDEIDAR
jgi:iron-sulfur cluster repair protein YtfE (RIC family)